MSDSPSHPSPVRLRREPFLLGLSRDHHWVLIHALRLRQAGQGKVPRGTAGVPATVEGFLAFHDDVMLGHEGDEEAVLLPAALASDPEGVTRIEQEHATLGALVARLASCATRAEHPPELMTGIGELLEAHVRYEERVFFETLQAKLTAEVKDALRGALDARRAERGYAPGCGFSG